MFQLLLLLTQEVIVDDLDPLNDSVEYEFGFDTRPSQLRHRLATTSHTPSTRPHPLAQYSISAPITSHMYPSLDENIQGGEEDTIERRTPPPSYESAVTSQYYMESAGYEYHPKGKDGLDQQRAIPKSSSTPLVSGYQ